MSTINLWSKVLEELKITASKPIFQTLLSQTDLISLEKDVATISCPNPYIQNMVETRYYSLLKAALDNQTKTNNSIVFTVKARVAPKTATGPLFEVINKKETPFKKETGLNPKYTFSTLVVGSSNNFAHAAARAIVQNPGNTYNPFFIWGGVGVGKTHLMQAIGHALLEKFPNLKILYCPSETFTNELINALQTKTIAEFKKKYRQPDVLLVDDIQFISGKEYNQEEFFHTFNSLYLSGKQIVLTADRRPDEISKVEERLTSRFMGGLTVDIQPPDYEMRVAILQAKCQEKNINPDQQALTFLAQMTNSNTRELEGTLMQVITQAQTQNSPIDLEFVKKFFGVKSKIHHKTISPNIVLSVVAKHFKTKPSDLLGSCRRQELVLPRQVAMYLLREEIEVPLMKIGEILGGRDHTTIMHGVKKISLRFNVDSSLRHEIMLIKQTLYG